MSSRRTKQRGDTCSNSLVDCSANLGDTRGGEIRARPAMNTSTAMPSQHKHNGKEEEEAKLSQSKPTTCRHRRRDLEALEQRGKTDSCSSLRFWRTRHPVQGVEQIPGRERVGSIFRSHSFWRKLPQVSRRRPHQTTAPGRISQYRLHRLGRGKATRDPRRYRRSRQIYSRYVPMHFRCLFARLTAPLRLALFLT